MRHVVLTAAAVGLGDGEVEDADVGHVGAGDVVVCPPHRKKRQYLRFLTSTTEMDANVGLSMTPLALLQFYKNFSH